MATADFMKQCYTGKQCPACNFDGDFHFGTQTLPPLPPGDEKALVGHFPSAKGAPLPVHVAMCPECGYLFIHRAK